MRKRESLGGGNGCIALQVRRRFPLVLNILFTRMQCDTSFGDAFQDKDKLSANKQRSCDASITSYIVLYAHTSCCCLGSVRCFLLCCHCAGTFQTWKAIIKWQTIIWIMIVSLLITYVCVLSLASSLLRPPASSGCNLIIVKSFFSPQIFKRQTNGIICTLSKSIGSCQRKSAIINSYAFFTIQPLDILISYYTIKYIVHSFQKLLFPTRYVQRSICRHTHTGTNILIMLTLCRLEFVFWF